MTDLISLIPVLESTLWLSFLLFLRIGAIMATLPVFGEQSIPVRVRLSVTVAFCFVVFSAMPVASIAPPETFADMIAMPCAEVISGLFFGLVLRFFVFALQIAGSIAAQTTSLSQIFGGSAGSDPQPAIGHVLVISGLALAALMKIHVSFAAYMMHSYVIVPVGDFLPSAVMSTFGIEAVSNVFKLGFTLAAPFMIGSLIYNITLGIINKAMPQLMVSFIGAPAITAGGLILLMLAIPTILSIWIMSFSNFVMLNDVSPL